MNYKELQEYIDSLKPMLKEAEVRYLLPLHRFDVIEKLGLSRKCYKGLLCKPRKLNYESIVSSLIHIDKNMDPKRLADIAIKLAVSLSWNGLGIPTASEMQVLLDEAGLTGFEILEFKSKFSVYEIKMLPVEGKAAIVFFLAKVIFDALISKNFDRLRKVNSLMLEMEIIEDFSDRKGLWDDFAIKGIKHYVEQEIYKAIRDELDELIEAKIALFDRVRDFLEDEAFESVIQNPFNPGIRGSEPTSFFNEDIRKKREAYSENRADIGELIAGILEDFDELKLKIVVDKQEIFDSVESIAVAEGFYAGLLSGDELVYIPVVHEILKQCHNRQPFPAFSWTLKQLDDEDAWNYSNTGSNGRKASNIYSGGDLVGLEFSGEEAEGNSTCMIPVGSYIAQLSGVSVPESIDVRMSIVNRLKDYGLSDRKARDIAVVIAALTAKSKMSSKVDDERSSENLYQEIKVQDIGKDTAELERLNARIADLEGQLRSDEKERKAYRHQIVSLEKEIKELDEKHKREIDQILSDTQFEDEKDDAKVSDIEYPYHTEKKITLYGGFDVFHRELSKLMPDIKIVEPCFKSPNLDVFRNSDMVFIQPNKMNHGNYFSVRDAAKHADVPYYHLRFACARKCADFMVGEIERHSDNI